MQTLKEYIESEIIPRYDNFDGAHRRDHVRSVIGQSQELSKYYDVNPKILYAAAAYHDLGLCEGREKHHLVSGRIIREDKTLLNWFKVEEIEVIAEAAEDHRASNETPPRSIYGKIIAESDRLIDRETVIRRTVQYGFAHYPQMNREQMLGEDIDTSSEEIRVWRLPETLDSGVIKFLPARRIAQNNR